MNSEFYVEQIVPVLTAINKFFGDKNKSIGGAKFDTDLNNKSSYYHTYYDGDNLALKGVFTYPNIEDKYIYLFVSGYLSKAIEK